MISMFGVRFDLAIFSIKNNEFFFLTLKMHVILDFLEFTVIFKRYCKEHSLWSNTHNRLYIVQSTDLWCYFHVIEADVLAFFQPLFTILIATKADRSWLVSQVSAAGESQN